MIVYSASCRITDLESAVHRRGLPAYRARVSTLMHRNTGRDGVSRGSESTLCSIDDLGGGEAEGTVRFGLDGTEYEIDRSAEHAQELRDALARYVRAGRRAGSGARRPARSGRKASASGLDTTQVRQWARTQGIDVKDRGRVPAELVVKFKAATGK
jgi:hypothetical protein